MPSDSAKLVGQAIRRIRKLKGMSLQDLASKSGVAVGMLSQVERDLGNPSLKTLTRIHQALDVPLSALFEDATDPHVASGTIAQELEGCVIRKGSRPRLQFGTPLLTKEMLSPSKGNRLQFMILNLLPGGSSGDSPLSYAAEKGGLIFSGSLELDLDGKKLKLNEGDSFQFDGATPHIFSNPYSEPASVLWIIAYDPVTQAL